MDVNIGTEATRILKLGTLKGAKPVISDKEKAQFVLEENINVIEQKVSESQIKI